MSAEAPASRPRVHELIEPPALRSLIIDALAPLSPRSVPLEEAAGLVLAEPVVAPFDLPRFANAAMDGFALRSEDTARAPVRLEARSERSLAGRPAQAHVARGEAMPVATGAMMPPGSDAVVAVEEVRTDAGWVMVSAFIPVGRHVRSPGEDVRAGEGLLERGAVLGPGQLAAAAAVGMTEVTVHPRPRVAILPTGDEVRAAGEPLEAGQIHDAASVPLSALVRELGCRPWIGAVTPDDADAFDAALRKAAERADAIVTVGGVSVGERDVVRLSAERGSVTAFEVSLRPAKPFAFGRVHGVPLFGLPGNPASALAAFEEFVRPGLLRMMGRTPSVRPAVRGRLAETIRQRPGRTHLLRAEVWREGDTLWVRPAGRPGAGMLHSLARATAWAVLPSHLEEVPAGSDVDVRLLIDPS